MTKKIWFMVLLTVAIISNISELAWAERDWEYWSHYEVVASVNDIIAFKVKPEVRYDDDFENHYYTHFDIGLDWKLKDWFILAVTYPETSNTLPSIKTNSSISIIGSGRLSPPTRGGHPPVDPTSPF